LSSIDNINASIIVDGRCLFRYVPAIEFVSCGMSFFVIVVCGVVKKL